MKSDNSKCRILLAILSAVLLGWSWIVLIPVSALAQTERGYAPWPDRSSAWEGVDGESPAIEKNELALPRKRWKSWMRYSLLVGAPAVTFLYGSQVWSWGETKSWRWGEERWFQQDTDAGGADKLGHLYAHYVINRVLYDLFSYTETSETRRLLFPVITTAIIGTMIEVGDAYTGRYGFSYEDLLADYMGIGLAFALDKYPGLERYIRVSAYYWPSKGFREFRTEEDKGMLNFPGDYSGWKFAFNFMLSGFSETRIALPEFLHYLQLDLGYYTSNYTRYDKPYGKPSTRHVFYGASVNFHGLANRIPYRNAATGLVGHFWRYYYLPLGWLPSHRL